MAYGTRCTNCGWQEMDHGNEGECAEDQDPNLVRKDYTHSLFGDKDACPEFIPNDPAEEFNMAWNDILNRDNFETGQEVYDAVVISDYPYEFKHALAHRLRTYFDARLARKQSAATTAPTS